MFDDFHVEHYLLDFYYTVLVYCDGLFAQSHTLKLRRESKKTDKQCEIHGIILIRIAIVSFVRFSYPILLVSVQMQNCVVAQHVAHSTHFPFSKNTHTHSNYLTMFGIS